MGTVRVILRNALRPRQKSLEPPKTYAAIHPFDQKFGVETSGHLLPEDLAMGKQEDLYNAGYFGVAPTVLRTLIESLGVDYERFTFVDLGSGKGRALLIASEYAFHAIVGVEMSPRLHAIAAANIAAYRGTAQRCRDVRSMEADATKFVFPAGPLVIYLWNPFEAPVFRIVLANLEASLAREPRDIFILYIHPELDGLFDASGCWRKLWRESIPMSEEDYAAHAFPSKTEVCSVYQSVSAS